MSASNDGSESVDQFLARIASLSRKQGTEDAERNKRMEEEMLQARKERQARRAERARSISPVKTGPAAPYTRIISEDVPTQRSIIPPISLTPRSQTQTPTKPDHDIQRSRSTSPQAPTFSTPSSRPLPPPPIEKPTTPTFASTNASSLSRSGTLSWQQRPTSRESSSLRSRTQPDPAGSLRSPTQSPRNPSPEREAEYMSRRDIEASLSKKDPSWFRQTQDRGIGSAAYRKGSNNSISDYQSSQRIRLPGMSPEPFSTTKVLVPENRRPLPELPKDSYEHMEDTPVQESNDGCVESKLPGYGSVPSSPSNRPQLVNPPSLLPNDPSSDVDPRINRPPGLFSTSGRPPSPTKGLGGFVQSAMLKRSDSVNKRWSVQANTGLKRGDSVAGNRSTFNPPSTNPLSLGHARTISRDPKWARDGTISPENSSRPSSSHGQDVESGEPQTKKPSTSEGGLSTLADTDGLVGSSDNAMTHHRPSTPPISNENGLARSPSKTLDPRRWSPTKASWLESALSKPESPRPNVMKNDAPAWKLDMQRSKLEKGSRNNDSSSSFDPVSVGGLLRSPPPGPANKPSNLMNRSAIHPIPKSPELKVQAEEDELQTTSDKPAKPNKPRHFSSEISPGSEASQVQIDDSQTSSMKIKALPEVKPKPIFEPVIEDKIKTTSDVLTSSVDSRSPLEKKLPTVKPKPQTPPTTDFRANLKSRQVNTMSTENQQPEFKAVFGKLKPTQTQNYVAPDELKDNITRGKAALSITGGPQKTKHVDEFKESILQKKEAMKAAANSPSESEIQRGRQSEKPAAEIPEALARRKTLHRTSPSKDARSFIQDIVKPDSTVNKSPEMSKPVAILGSKSESIRSPALNPIGQNSVKEMPSLKPAVPIQLKPTSVQAKGHETKEVQLSTSQEAPISSKDLHGRLESSSPPKQSVQDSSKIAARLNPSLASFIARGTGVRPVSNNEQSVKSVASLDASDQKLRGVVEDDQDNSQLTHMTKGRAKGPKRRAPKADSLMNKSVVSKTDKPTIVHPTKSFPAGGSKSSIVTQAKTAFAPSMKNDKSEDQPIVKAAPFTAASNADTTVPMQMEPQKKVEEKVRPNIAAKSPELRKASGSKIAMTPKNELLSNKSSSPNDFNIATDKIVHQNTNEASRSLGQSTITPRFSPSPMLLTPSKSKLNSPKQRISATDSNTKLPPVSKAKFGGLGLDFESSKARTLAATELTPPSDHDSNLQSLQEKTKKPGRNSEQQNAQNLLEKLFGTTPRVVDRAEFNTEAFIMTRTEQTEKIKTVSHQIWEVTGDGKRTPMPSQQEHILYEECMYLSVHGFESGKGSKTSEAYLWCGAAVAEAAAEDAQLFCRKIARESSAKLEVIKQGKETSSFFQALGGIVLTRKNKSSAFYMLCGRRYLGHVAFDEVEFSANSLCSGFPFLISAKFGKLYLWKGHGSCADEIGAARLIGMDLGLTGEIEEVSQDQEPASFWEAFPEKNAKTSFQSSEVWSLRSDDQHKGFPCKLYRVEQDQPKSGGFWGLRASSPGKASNKASLQEIVPFCQRDLDPDHVHILDAYANFYVIPGIATPSKATDFVTALFIAQDMTVLSPSVQDRSLLPSCTVVFGEPPQEMKATFRKWTPNRAGDSNESECIEVAEVINALA